MELNVHDIEAAADTFAKLAEASDDLSLEDALAHLAALEQAKAQLGSAISLVETQVRKLLDSPREANGKLYFLKGSGEWRPDHSIVRAKVVSRCAVDSAGEIRPTVDALNMAWDLIMKLYVAPKTKPKSTGLDALGLKTEDVCTWESTGKKIVAEPLGGPE